MNILTIYRTLKIYSEVTKIMKKDSAIIYESVYKTIELIPDTELKWEAIKGLLRYGFYGEELSSDSPLVEMVYTSAFPSLMASSIFSENTSYP